VTGRDQKSTAHSLPHLTNTLLQDDRVELNELSHLHNTDTLPLVGHVLQQLACIVSFPVSACVVSLTWFADLAAGLAVPDVLLVTHHVSRVGCALALLSPEGTHQVKVQAQL